VIVLYHMVALYGVRERERKESEAPARADQMGLQDGQKQKAGQSGIVLPAETNGREEGKFSSSVFAL